ncbi:MAG TPA: AsmA-like C-terminal region-containing protein, partial [Candidatus Bathyarchaeia archaeon]|nr:AsmA-like C-terminal region-containing protein [Candidatus Bathyarchaeia archaeon]
IEYTLNEGLVVRNIVISEKDDPKALFFQAKKISCKIPIGPLLKKKQVILPHVVIDGFSANLTRLDEETWNFSDLFKIRPSGGDQPFQILIGKFSLLNGETTLQDQLSGTPPLVLSLPSLQAGFSLPQKIAFDLDLKMKTGPGTLKLAGNYYFDPAGLDFTAKITELDLVNHVQPFLPLQLPFRQGLIHLADLSLQWEKDLLKIKATAQSDIDTTINTIAFKGDLGVQGLEFVQQPGLLTISATQLTTNQAALTIAHKIVFDGQIQTKNIKLSQAPEEFSLTGELTAAARTLSVWGDYTLNDNTFAVTNIQIKNTKIDGLSAQAAINAENFSLNYKNIHLAGGLSIPLLTVKQLAETLTATLPLSLNKASLNYENNDTYLFQGNLTADSLDITQDQTNTKIDTTFSSGQLAFTLPENRNGTAAASVRALFRTDRRDPVPGYSIAINLKQGEVNNPFPGFDNVHDIHGDIEILPEQIVFKNFLCRLQNTDLIINGSLRGFSKLVSDLVVSAKNIDIQQWLPVIKNYVDTKGIDASGTTDLNINIGGALVPPGRPDFSLTAGLRSAQVKLPQLPDPFTKISGNITYKNDFLSWDNLSLSFQDKTYTSNGNLKKFAAPMINAKIQTEDLYLMLIAEAVGNDTYEISRGDFKTKLSSFSTTGKIAFNQDSPYMDIRSEGQVTLSDLGRFHPLIKEKIEQLKIHGKGSVLLSYNGKINDPMSASYSVTYQSADSSIYNLLLKNLRLKTTQSAPYENAFDVTSDFYNGSLSANGTIAFKNDYPLKLQAALTTVDVGGITNSLALKRQFGGTCTASVFLEGPVKQTSGITGQGNIKIEKGYFEKSNFLKGILALILSQEYQDATFTDAKAKVFIRDNQLRLKDIYLKSSAVTLTGFGWVDINQN